MTALKQRELNKNQDNLKLNNYPDCEHKIKTFIKVEYWFQSHDDYDFDIINIESPKTIEEIQKICSDLRGHHVAKRHIIIIK